MMEGCKRYLHYPSIKQAEPLNSFKFFDLISEINAISSHRVIRKVRVMLFLRNQENPE